MTKLHWRPSDGRGKRTGCGRDAKSVRCAYNDREFLVNDKGFAPGYRRGPGKVRCRTCWKSATRFPLRKRGSR